MIRGPDSQRSPAEQIPDGWKAISPLDEEFKDLDQIHARISRRTEIDWDNSTKMKTDVIDGFEDVLREPLGQGFGGFYNTNFAVYQLAFALSRSSHPAINELISNKSPITSSDAIKKLRQEFVLRGLRIIDLGCSQVPAFALAASSLGADVYTVDAQDISKEHKTYLKGHTVLDLNNVSAPKILKNHTGGELDLVTESVIGAGLSAPRGLRAPKATTVMKIADALLKKAVICTAPLLTEK